MLSYILYFLLILSFICSIFTNNGANVSSAVATGAIDAIKLSINILAMMAFWSGIIRLSQKNGITKFLNKIIKPFLKRLFTHSAKDEICFGLISLNFISNMMGLSNASTPSGIAAIKRMNEIKIPDKEKGKFILINCCSLQFIPTTVAAIRATNGSKNSFDIIVPVLFTSLITIIFALILYEVLCIRNKR